MPDRWLLTGASGFVGSHVLREILATTDHEVVCLVSFKHRGSGDRLRRVFAEDPSWQSRVTVVHHDLTLPFDPLLKDSLWGVTVVLNVASESHVDRSITHPGPFVINNVALIVNLLEWARTRPITRFIQVSTDEVYGPAEPGYAHREWEDLHRPSNPYSASKAAQEDIAYSYWRTYDVPLIITNTMNLFGETQHPEKFIPKVIHTVRRGGVVPIHGIPGEEVTGSRFYLHAGNQANALIYLATHGDPDAYGEAQDPDRFHIVGQQEVTNLQMAQMIADMVGEPLRYEIVDFHSSRPGHDLRYALDGSLLDSAGWKAPLGFEESLERTVTWTLAHPEWELHD